MSKINAKFGNPFFWITQQIHQVLDERLKSKVFIFFVIFDFFLFLLFAIFIGLFEIFLKISKKDYLQILIDSQSDEADSALKKVDAEHFDPSGKLIEKKMTYDVIKTKIK